MNKTNSYLLRIPYIYLTVDKSEMLYIIFSGDSYIYSYLFFAYFVQDKNKNRNFFVTNYKNQTTILYMIEVISLISI